MTYALPFLRDQKILELGGGHVPLFRPNVDARWGPATDFIADFEQPLPIQSDEWDGVYSAYAIEHLSWRKLEGFVREIFRILRPGGVCVIVTANAEAQMRWALAQDWDEKVSQCLGGDQTYLENAHKTFFDPAWISRLFRSAGFGSTIVIPHGALGTDLILEATKPLQ